MIEKGLLHVYTGDGKGKTTASLGLVLRASGYDHKALMIQFIKGDWHYGELTSQELLPNFCIERYGLGFVGIQNDPHTFEEHRLEALKGLARARKVLESKDFDLVILDELNVVNDLGLINDSEVKSLLDIDKGVTNLVITGRGAKEFLLKKADLVTNMIVVKHPFDKGIFARKGLEF